ncbi:hypothetical protein KI387_043620 [Taxus chinensis]|uniref:Protein kinase domain-containing protein n=1 Tax=Taxus chinensis TaxID=29808 RepID=A0AA38C1C2_TAXCH|nr:hypothetical protein KI387_043620 [Taxus chinensis]
MGICVSRRSKVDTSITSTGTQSAETKNPNDSSKPLAVSQTTSSSGTSAYTESIPSTPKVENELILSSKLKKFSFSWIEENGTAPVKLGTGLTVAVKTLNPDGLQGHKEWLAEVNFLGQLHHPNLVKLVGYCIEDDQRLLVYEFMPRGSLENHRSSEMAVKTWSEVNNLIQNYTPFKSASNHSKSLSQEEGQLETINTWELMEGLEDNTGSSPLVVVNEIAMKKSVDRTLDRSFSFHSVKDVEQLARDEPKCSVWHRELLPA